MKQSNPIVDSIARRVFQVNNPGEVWENAGREHRDKYRVLAQVAFDELVKFGYVKQTYQRSDFIPVIEGFKSMKGAYLAYATWSTPATPDVSAAENTTYDEIWREVSEHIHVRNGELNRDSFTLDATKSGSIPAQFVVEGFVFKPVEWTTQGSQAIVLYVVEEPAE